MIRYQPAMAYNVSKTFRNFRSTDMNRGNIGKTREGILVESSDRNQNVIEGADLVLATGSTLVNGSIDNIRDWAQAKHLYFFGVTIAAAVYELVLNRLCFEAG